MDLSAHSLLYGYVRDYSRQEQEMVSSNCSCDMHPKVEVLLHILPVCNMPLVPSWVLAVMIGVVGGVRLSPLGRSSPSSLSYSLTFFLYAIMITSGLFVHCLFLVECGDAAPSKAYFSMAILDASLTSCVAVSFIFDGLVDLDLLQERSALVLMLSSYGVLFYAYIAEVVQPSLLYKASVLVGCSLYLISQCLMLHKRSSLSLLCLLLAGVSGGVSFLLFTQYGCWLCAVLGAWSVEGVWYYGSDLAMFFLLLYIFTFRPTILQPSQLKHTIATPHTPQDEVKQFP